MTPSSAPSAADEVSARAEIGVIGGSGLYQFLDDHETVAIDTPFGRSSDPLVVGEVEGRRVAFVARHGRGHRFPPHGLNYRANLWALRAVGVRQVLAPCAVGSLRAESLMHRAAGGSIVGMTTMPEAAIARELAMCFTTIAMVTDADAGVEAAAGVTHEEVVAAFAGNVEHLKTILADAIGGLPEHEPDARATCSCRRSLDGIALPFPLP